VAAAARLRIPLDTYRIGAEVEDPAGRFAEAYGVEPGGATLIRPDGFVAWRARGPAPAGEHEAGRALGAALARSLCRPLP
jgi:hypothetical protein